MKSQPAPVIFDLDGTLLDTAPDLASALNALLIEEGHQPLSISAVRSMVGQGAVEMIKKGLAESGESQPSGILQGTLRSRFLEHYQNCYLQATRPFPSVVDTLRQLQETGHPMAVCTNKSYEMSVAILNGLALDTYFCGIIGGDTLPVAKPDPEPVEAAIALTRGCKSASIMVGDSITDVNAAHAAGIAVVAVSFGYTEIAPNSLGADAVIDHFDQLIPAITKISAAHTEKA
jgi:phosphoglycolate phosphatase